MEFETIERCGRIHGIVNGVESPEYISYSHSDEIWYLYIPHMHPEGYHHPSNAFIDIAERMGNWYTAAESADMLVKMGAFGEPPSAKEICGWARHGLLPGSVKISAPGQGGSWRIPGAALEALAQRRKGQ